MDLVIRFARWDADVQAAHDLFMRRIGPHLVEDAASFRLSACVETADWVPRLALALIPGGECQGKAIPHREVSRPQSSVLSPQSWLLAGAQLGGLLPAVGMVSLPYTAVDEQYEGRGVYLRLKRAMLAELAETAQARGLPPPIGNVSEEAPGSAQYERKVGRGIATVFPLPYTQPAVQGLDETPLALTFEPLVHPAPAFSDEDHLRIVAAVYRGLYRIARPEDHPALKRIVAAAAPTPLSPRPLRVSAALREKGEAVCAEHVSAAHPSSPVR